MKPVEFCGSSLEDLRAFPRGAKRACGFQIDRLQRGLEPQDWKPMSAVGAGVREIRISEAEGAFRVIYLAKFSDAIYVLHCFQKKTAKTAATDIELARARYNALVRERRKALVKERRK